MSLRQNDTKAHFNTIPWCSRLLASPDLRTLPPASRTPKPRTGEDSFFAETLQSPRTIRASLAFYPRPAPKAKAKAKATTPAYIPSLSVLYDVGDGLNGWPSVLHGGMVAALADEAMGTLLVVNAERAHLAAVATGHKHGEWPDEDELGAHTAELKITYAMPVVVPGVVLVKCRIVAWEGRKISMVARVVQKSGLRAELDGHMHECAVSEALLVEPRGSKL